MPSAFGHALFASALAASFRARGAVVAAAILCAVAPDLDVIAFRFDIPYASPFGHRGFTHSLAFAALLGAAATLVLHALPLAARPAFAPTFVLLARGPSMRLLYEGDGDAESDEATPPAVAAHP